jgi:hypothetical protein
VANAWIAVEYSIQIASISITEIQTQKNSTGGDMLRVHGLLLRKILQTVIYCVVIVTGLGIGERSMAMLQLICSP